MDVKISSRGRELLQNYLLAAKVSRAIAANGLKIYTKEGVLVEHDGKKVVVKSACS